MKKYVNCMYVVIISLFAISLNGQTTWQLKNPKIPDVGSGDVFFINESEGWIVGEDDEIMHTSDGGFTWETIYKFTNDFIDEVFFVDENLGFLAGRRIQRTLDGGLTWERVLYNSMAYSFRVLFFINDQTGWVGNSEGDIYKTEDGGTFWVLQDHPANESYIVDIFFIDEQHGWVLFQYGSLLKTENGGLAWDLVQDEDNHDNWFRNIFFLNETKGWVTPQNNYIFETDDGANTFDTIFIETENPLYGTKFFDENNGLSYSGFYLFKTSDGGETWQELPIPGTYIVNSTSFPTPDYMCVINGGINFSSDGGNSWDAPDEGFFNQLNAVAYAGNKLFVAGEDGLIKRSGDKGNTWEILPISTEDYIHDIFFIDETKGWICGQEGMLYYTEDNGDTWVQKDLNLDNNLNALFFVDDQIGFLAGNYGVIYKTENAGIEWFALETGSDEHLWDVFFIDDQTGWFCASGGLVRKTTDGGVSFENYQTPEDISLSSIFFSNEMIGWVVGMKSIFYTENGGADWIVQYTYDSPSSGNILTNIKFINETEGWVCGKKGTTLHTQDGGLNWVEHPGFDYYNSLVLVSETEAFAVGRFGCVIYTDMANYLAPQIIQHTQDTIACEGQDLTLVVDAIGDSLTFQWQYINNPIPGATSNTLEISSISPYAGGLYKCEITNKVGIVTTNNIVVSIRPRVQITSHPPDMVTFVNDTVSFIVGVSGALPIYYQWQKNGIDIEGAVHNVFAIYGVQLADSGYYRCIVSNDCNADSTELAKLTVHPASGKDDLRIGGEISIYPNPVKDKCVITFAEKIMNGELIIYNYSGDLVYSQIVSVSDQVEIKMNNLSIGIYILRFIGSDFEFTSKIIKD